MRRELTRDPSAREQKRRKIDRCQEDAGLGVRQKMGLIPPSIPVAFPLFEVTSGPNFPHSASSREEVFWVGGRRLWAAPAFQGKQRTHMPKKTPPYRSVSHCSSHRDGHRSSGGADISAVSVIPGHVRAKVFGKGGTCQPLKASTQGA